MDHPQCLNAYEEVRRMNMERNAEVMRSLGLLPTSFLSAEDVRKASKFLTPSCVIEEGDEVNVDRTLRRRGSKQQKQKERRRSARIASRIPETLELQKSSSTAKKEDNLIPSMTDLFEVDQATEERKTSNMDMEDYNSVDTDDSSEESERNEYEAHASFAGDGNNSVGGQVRRNKSPHETLPMTSTMMSLDSTNDMMATAFGSQFHDLVFHAVMESTSALIGSRSGIRPPLEGGEVTISPVYNTEAHPLTTWQEATFRKAEARRNRKPQMLRTSAGEDSDSQEDFRAPGNETCQQRALRIRRLNRFRAKRSKELTSNRKAVKKCSYVIHVDGTGRGRGIHKRQWRAAIRGQCSRLDPSMDNMNHHPKAVVDSLWYALQKEWEFEGFSHRAREMFEKAATKFMRNRKMQLKYKFKKIKTNTKPDDVTRFHWSNIVDLTNNSSKHPMSTSSSHITLKGKEKSSEAAQETDDFSQNFQGMESNMSWTNNMTVEKESQKDEESIQTFVSEGIGKQISMSPSSHMTVHEVSSSKNENVDARIDKLKRKLLRLQNSIELGHAEAEKEREVGLNVSGRHDSMVAFDTASVGMKENVMPEGGLNQNSQFQMCYGATSQTMEKVLQGKSLLQPRTYVSMPMRGGEKKNVNATIEASNGTEMECGDNVVMLAIVRGRTEEIGKAILMGFSGSKFSRKVIPKGWCSVKVISCTDSGGYEICPFPAGWKDQVQEKTVKSREGETTMWPENLLHC